MLGVPRGGELSKRPTPDPAPALYRILQDGRELAVDELPMQRAVRGENVSGQIMDVVREDGRTVRLYSNASPLLDEQGRPRGAVGAFLDITELTDAQEALQGKRGPISQSGGYGARCHHRAPGRVVSLRQRGGAPALWRR